MFCAAMPQGTLREPLIGGKLWAEYSTDRRAAFTIPMIDGEASFATAAAR